MQVLLLLEQYPSPLQCATTAAGSLLDAVKESIRVRLTTRQSDHELDPRSNTELFVDRVQMNFDDPFGHAQSPTNFLIGKSLTDQTYNLLLAWLNSENGSAISEKFLG